MSPSVSLDRREVETANELHRQEAARDVARFGRVGMAAVHASNTGSAQ